MAKEAGVVKFISGKAVAIDQNGNERELKVGDILYMGESIKTSDAADKITIVSNNGKEITIVGNDTLALNQSTIGAEGLADVSDLQNAILNGGDLTKLEETAAGGNTAAGGGDGVSLGDAKFAEGGHYSNINATYRNLSDTNRAFASYDSPISGYNGGDDTIIPSNPLVTFISDLNNDGTLSRVEHARDTNLNTSKVLITIPNDGTVRAGDILNITITKPDGNTENKTIPITPTIISNGYQFDAPIQTGKISKVDATITNFQGNVSGRSEDSVTSSGFSTPEVKFTEDNSPDNNLLTYTENAKDGKLNETPVLITVKDVIVGDVLHVTLTKPNGTTEVRNVSINQNIIDNGYKIDNMPVEHGKPSKVEAYVADSTNTMRSATASDSTTLDVKPTLTFTEDQDNNGYLYDPENSQDNNFRSTTVEITLPKDVVVGDKIVITYTDPLHTSQNLEKSITLTQEMIDNQKVNTSLPIFPDVRTSASVHVVDKNNVRKSEESDQDSVMPIGRNLEMTLPEEKTLHEISRQESTDDNEVNKTTARITLPNKIDNGDKLTLTITGPDPDDPVNNPSKTYTREFTIHMDSKGVVTSVTENGTSNVLTPTKVGDNQYIINVSGIQLKHGEDTTIKAKVTNLNPNRHTSINESEVSASLEYVKKPEVVFGEANGTKSMSREQAMSDHDLNSTTVTIKLPKNAVSGDKLTVTIKEPNEATAREIKYTIGKDNNGKFFVKDSNGNKVDTETDGRSFKISGIKTATGLETKVTAEIKDKDGIQHAEDTSTVTISNINDMAVYFKEDADRNVSLTRAESKDSDGDLHKTTVVVKVPNNVITGDMVTVKIDNGTSPKTYKVTGRDPSGKIMLEDTSTHTSITASDKNEIEIPGVEIIAGKTINVTTETTDASGGKKAEAQNHNTLEKLHEDMEITFEKDTDNDGILGSAEATGATTIATIKLPSNFVIGDKLIVESYNEDTPENKLGSKTYEIVKDNNGKLIAKHGSEELDITDDADSNKVVKYTLGLTEDHKTIINAKVTDNTGADKVETNSDITLDAQGSGSGTGFRLFIDEDKDRNGVLSRDEAMKDGKLNTTSATLQIPTTVNSGDIIKVKVNGGAEKTYTVASNDGTNVTIKDAGGSLVALEPGNKLKISNVHIDKDHPAVVEATINGVTKTAKATLESVDTKNLKIEFVEDNASRDKVIDRDEAILDNDIKKTIISVQVPHNVTNGDKIAVTIKEPQTNGTTGSRTITYIVSKTANGKISLTDDATHITTQLANNTIKIPGVAMLPGRETSAVATITNGAETTTSSEAKAKLAPLSEAGLSVSIVADKNDNGIISRDESGSKISKVHVSIPGSVIAGDKIDVKITNPNGSTLTKHYEVMRKDVNGKITLKNLDDNSQQTLDRDKPLDLDATIAVDKETKAEVTLTDTFGESKTVSDTAHAEIDAIRGIMFNKDIKTSENGERSTTVKVYLNEDARNGDTVEFKYTDPDNHHALTKTATHTLSAEDITKGVFEQSLDINARSAYDLEVKATLKTSDSDGLESKSYEPYKPLHIGVENYTVKFDASKDMKGGKGNDTLVFDGDKVDFNNISNLDSKVESFENLELKGETKIKFNAQNILDITDNPDTVLKIKGGDVDANGNKITKVDLVHKWTVDHSYDTAGFKGYSSIDQINGKTIHIQIDDKIHTDL